MRKFFYGHLNEKVIYTFTGIIFAMVIPFYLVWSDYLILKSFLNARIGFIQIYISFKVIINYE